MGVNSITSQFDTPDAPKLICHHLALEIDGTLGVHEIEVTAARACGGCGTLSFNAVWRGLPH